MDKQTAFPQPADRERIQELLTLKRTKPSESNLVANTGSAWYNKNILNIGLTNCILK